MTENIYQAPQADITIGSEVEDYYVVSSLKFFVFFFLSLGIYQLYWFYRNWKLHKIKNNSNEWPVARAIFFIFYTHAMFGLINKDLARKDIQSNWQPMLMATIFIGLALIGNLSGQLVRTDFWHVSLIFMPYLFLPFQALILHGAQTRANVLCGDPKGDSNSKFTVANFAWLALGLVYIALIGAGVYLALV